MLLSAAVWASCLSGGSRNGAIVPVSEFSISLMESNTLPLEPVSLTRDSSGVRARYHFFSRNCLCASDARLVCRGTATLNGTSLLPVNGCFPIGGLVVEGENVIEVCGEEEMGPVSLVGDFGVWASAEEGWFTDRGRVPGTGLLARQGYPFYSGEISYRCLFDVPQKAGKRILGISSWKGTACSVWVNNKKVADVNKRRFKMNIGPYLKAGVNEVVVLLSGSSGEMGLKEEPTLK